MTQGTVLTIPLEEYVYGVVMGELGSVVPSGTYSGQSWDDDVVKAQSIASRTWGSYFCSKRDLIVYPPNIYVRGVYDNSNDQVYRPNRADFPSSTKQGFIDLSNRVRDLYISYDGLNLWDAPFNGKLLDAEFRSDVGNPSCSWVGSDSRSGCTLNGVVTGYDYLRKVNNPHNVNLIRKGPGFAQLPSQAWARRNTGTASWYQLLTHYYTGIQIMNKYVWFNTKYYNNTGCSGSPAVENSTNSINYDWGTGSPVSGVNADNFCVEFESTTINFPDMGGNNQYTFFILADDGFRLYVDNNLVLDKWLAQSPHQYSVTMNMTPGTHAIRLRYYEAGGGAVVRMSWMPGFGMVGQYFDNIIGSVEPPPIPMDDDPFINRPDPTIQFDWETYSPLDTREGPRFYEDTFSALWEGYIYTPNCQTTVPAQFGTLSDDGVILKIDNQVVINQWNDHGATQHYGYKVMCTGTHPVELRYYENGGGAVIKLTGLWW